VRDELNGYEKCARLKRPFRGKNVKVLLLEGLCHKVNRGTAIGLSITLLCLIPNNVAGDSFTWATVGVVVFCGGAAWKAKDLRVRLPALCFVGLFFLLLVATLWQGSQDKIPGFFRYTFAILPLIWLASNCNPRERRTIEVWMVGIASFEAVLAIVQKYFGIFPTWGWMGSTVSATAGTNPLTGDFGRAPGTLGHGIPAALILCSGMLVVIFADVVSNWFLRVLLIVTMSVGILATGSRSAVIVLVPVVLIIAILSMRGKNILRVTLICAIVCLTLFLDVWSLPIFTSLDGSVSVSHRSIAWNLISETLLVNPQTALIGFGWGGPEKVLSGISAYDRLAVVDNGFVIIIALVGALGLVLFVGALALGLVNGDKTSRAIILMNLGMMLSFDIPLWAANFAIFTVFLGLPRGNLVGQDHLLFTPSPHSQLGSLMKFQQNDQAQISALRVTLRHDHR
jgi:hypothetical protein